jgi:O-antigen/teichoic acid export membrane protein
MLQAFRGRLAGLRSSGFVQNVAVLTTGTAFAQAMTVAASPILSRLYSPEDFGLLGIVMSISGPIAVVSCLKYELAIVLAPDDREANEVLILCFLVCLLMTIAALIAVAFVGPWVAMRLDISAQTKILLVIPVIVLIGGCLSALVQTANRKRQYKRMSLSAIVRSGVTVVMQIGLAAIGFAGHGLIIGRIVGAQIAVLPLLPPLLARPPSGAVRLPSPWKLLRAVRTYESFPRFDTPKTLLVEVSKNFPAIFLGLLFGPATAGFYWFTTRLLEMPTTLIGKAVRRVYYQEAAITQRDGKAILPLWRKATTAMSLMASIPAAVLVAFAPPAFEFVFGSEWREAGRYAQWLALWWFSTFSNIPSSTVVPVLGLQAAALMFELGGLTLRALAILSALLLGDALLAIALYSIAGCIVNFALIIFIYWNLKDEMTPAPAAGSTGDVGDD